MEIMKLNSPSVCSANIVSKREDDLDNKQMSRPVKKILTEEQYTEKMEKIITRDFFPDLPKLKAQNEYLSAVEKGDVAKMQEIQLTYQPALSTRSRFSSFGDTSSATFDTPSIGHNDSPIRNNADLDDSTSVVHNGEKKKESLDEFLSKTTSEDNASFQTIMEKSSLLHQQKYPWLYKDEKSELKKISDTLCIESSESQKASEKPALITWAYKNRNSLMYVPDGAEFTAEEKLAYENRKIVHHSNTRFEAPPFDEEANKEAIAEAASVQAKMKEGKVGIDGKEIIPGESPQVNGYGFVGTPIPNPGVSDTPIMTWGEIEGTPFRLDGSDTPLPQNPNGQQFKIPNLSAREKIALSLADKAAKKHRKVNKVQSDFKSPFRLGSMTPHEKLQSMSPAARKLACAKLGIHRDTDKALRASYSPSPLQTPNSCRTPQTPVLTPVNKTAAVITLNDTQTLLNLPKRPKASDFF